MDMVVASNPQAVVDITGRDPQQCGFGHCGVPTVQFKQDAHNVEALSNNFDTDQSHLGQLVFAEPDLVHDWEGEQHSHPACLVSVRGVNWISAICESAIILEVKIASGSTEDEAQEKTEPELVVLGAL